MNESKCPMENRQPNNDKSEDDDYLWGQRIYIQERAEISSLYHRKRERFFALCDRWSKAFSLISGTAAFSSLLPSADAKSWAGLMVGLSTLPGLVLSWNDRSRLHGELAQKFLAIESEIAKVGKRNFTEEQLDDWHSRIVQIEVGEPATLSALVAICHNQIKSANGDSSNLIRLSFMQKLFAHLFDMEINGRREAA